MIVLKDNFLGREDLSLVLAESGNAGELYALEKECFPADPWSEYTFAETMKNPACRLFCVYNMQMQKIIAYSVVYVAGDEGDLANIAVLPECRGRGLGGALLDEILKIVSNDGVFRTFLEVRESNASAIGLYLSRGFAEIGKRRRYYKNPTEDALLMMLEH